MGTEWEYITFVVRWEKSKSSTELNYVHDWCVKYSDGSELQGWTDIFDHYGRHGWELFSVVVVDEGTTIGGNVDEAATALRFFGKRPK